MTQKQTLAALKSKLKALQTEREEQLKRGNEIRFCFVCENIELIESQISKVKANRG